MRKVLVSVLCLALVFSMTACGSSPANNTTAAPATTAAAAAGADSSSSEAPTSETAVPAQTDHPDVVKVGVLFPMTGGSAVMGAQTLAGARMAFDNHNASGGIQSMGGAKIELILADTTGQPEVGVTEAERLIVREGVDVLFGPYNSAVGASTAPVADRYGVPYLLVSANVDSIMENDYSYAFRANFPMSAAAMSMVEYFVDISKLRGTPGKDVFIVYENSDFGKGTADGLLDFSKEAGLEVKGMEGFTSNAADLSGIVLKIKEANPEIVFCTMYLNDAVLFTNQMHELDCNVPIFGAGGGFTIYDYIEKTGALSEGVMTVCGWNDDLLEHKPKETRELYEQFQSDYAPEPGALIDDHAAAGYTNAAILIRALEDAGTVDKEAIRNAFATMDIQDPNDPVIAFQTYEGVKFEDVRNMHNQNPYALQNVAQVIDGTYRLVGPVNFFDGNTPAIWPIPSSR